MKTYKMYITKKGEAYCQYCFEGLEDECAESILRYREKDECVNCRGDYVPSSDTHYIAPSHTHTKGLK